MKKIDITGIAPEARLFHNEKIATYKKYVDFADINFWEENLRTVLAFDTLERDKNKRLKDISLEEVTDFLAGRYEMQLVPLANSIKQNGVRLGRLGWHVVRVWQHQLKKPSRVMSSLKKSLGKPASFKRHP